MKRSSSLFRVGPSWGSGWIAVFLFLFEGVIVALGWIAVFLFLFEGVIVGLVVGEFGQHVLDGFEVLGCDLVALLADGLPEEVAASSPMP